MNFRDPYKYSIDDYDLMDDFRSAARLAREAEWEKDILELEQYFKDVSIYGYTKAQLINEKFDDWAMKVDPY